MGELSREKEESQETNKPSIADLKSLTYFYMKRFDKMANDEKSPKVVKEGYQKKLDAMRDVNAILDHFQNEGINTTEAALLELAGEEAKGKSQDVENLNIFKEFLESNKDMLPADFLRDKENIEEELRKSEEEK